MYCERAVKINLSEICFTPHFECDPERREKDWFVRIGNVIHPMENWKWLDVFFEEIDRASIKYKHYNLKVKAGIEIGYDIGLEKTIEKLVNNYPFDFILGSVHCLEHCAISSREESLSYFYGKTVEQVIKQYYYVVDQMIETKLFDCVGHLDLYRRYGLQYLGPEVEEVHYHYTEPVIRKISQYNMGIEINTSSRRRGHREFHPSRELLKLAVNCGVQIFTLGSDAHSVKELGDGIAEADKLLKNMGQAAAVFNRRQPELLSK